jgi:hypothetical protein
MGFFYVLYSTLLHLPLLRFHYADGCWDCADGCWLILFAADGLSAVNILEPLLLLVSLLLLASLVSLLLLASLLPYLCKRHYCCLFSCWLPNSCRRTLCCCCSCCCCHSFCALCHYFADLITFGACIPTILPYLLLLASPLWLASLLMGHVVGGVAIVAGGSLML